MFKKPNGEKSNTSGANAAGTSGVQCVCLFDLYCKYHDKANKEPVYGEKIRERIGEYKGAYRSGDRSAATDSPRKLVEELHNAPLIVPFNYDREHEFEGDRTIHFTANAAAKYNFDSAILGAELKAPEQLSGTFRALENGAMFVRRGKNGG